MACPTTGVAQCRVRLVRPVRSCAMPGERPSRLAFAATHVVKASRVLSWGEKALWLETYALDMGPEGAWLNNACMGQRLGLEERTVKNYRTRLHRVGLLRPIPPPPPPSPR